MATVAELITLLEGHDVPPDRVPDLIDALPGIVLLDEPAEVLAADLAECHPPLGPDEVRVRVHRSHGPADRRIVVVAHDRPGLLAATAGALAAMGLSVRAVSAATWEERDTALHGVTVSDPLGRRETDREWEEVRADVEAVIRGLRQPPVPFRPGGPVKVVASPVLDGQTLVTVEAPDRVGLLWAIASWFEGRGHNVIAARLSDIRPGVAGGTLVVDRPPDVEALVAHLAGRRRRPLLARLRDASG